MFVLHGAWTAGDQLALWAEDAARPRAAKGRAGKRARPHPFAAQAEALRLLVGDRGEIQPLPLLLPSTTSAPTPSPRLWSEDPSDPPTSVRPWVVPSVALSAGPAFDWLLTRCPIDAAGLGGAPTPVLLGGTVRYLAQIARFALELGTRGQIAPGLIRRGRTWEARWRPFTADPDDDARRWALLRGLPPLLRVSGGVDRPAEEILDGALLAMADACAREAIRTPLRRVGRSIEARWLRALSSDEPALPDGPETESLAEALDGWLGAAGRPSDGFRTCFRITAPEDEGPWRLDLLLQAVDDPSLQIPAAEIWRTRGQVLRAAGRSLRDPQERLLADLGRAGRIAPAIRSALRSARPEEVALDPEGAWTFLRASAPALARSGFGILAPRWWDRPGARLGLSLQASPKASGPAAIGLDSLCSVRWEVALGDDILTPDELRRLAALKAPLLRIRGRWVELRPEEIEAALAFYARAPTDGEATARDVLRLGLGIETADSPLPIASLSADGWLGELLSEARLARFAPVAAPEGFGTALRPYQERGLGWLLFHDALGLGSCLADDMGLGKTVQLLALLAHERSGGDGPRAPTLLICPMSLIGNWRREAARFAPTLRVAVHHGSGRGTIDPSGVDLVLTTYGLAFRDAELLGAVSWGRVVLDEAQNIKNASTRQAKAIHGIRSPRRIALTGTPVENRLSELWSILQFLNPGLLGTAPAFRRRFALPIERYGDAEAAARLQRITGPFVLRRLKTDKAIAAELPDKLEMKVICTLTREQATLYQAAVDDLLERLRELDGMARRGAVLSAMTRLKQICDHPALLLQDRSPLPGRSGKLARLEEILDLVVANGEKALVFTQFAEMGHPLKAHLQDRLGREVLFLYGGTARPARDAMIERFGAPDGPPVFLLSLKAGGTGLNLVSANHVIHFDRWWNPAVEDQATDRAFRLGQTRDVQVRKLVCAGTLEDRIDAMIEQKRALAGKVVGAGESWLADLSTDALRELVALSDDAVEED